MNILFLGGNGIVNNTILLTGLIFKRHFHVNSDPRGTRQELICTERKAGDAFNPRTRFRAFF